MRGTGTPTDRDNVKRREVWQCEGWVCDLETIGSPSIFRLMHSCSLHKNIPDFRFELSQWGACGVVGMELVGFRNLNSWSNKNRSVSRSTVIHHLECVHCYYEQQIKWELKRIHTSGCRWNERLKPKTDGSKCLSYTGLRGDLEHLTIVTRLKINRRKVFIIKSRGRYLLLSQKARGKEKTYISVSVW